MTENEILITFQPKGDEDVLQAIKKVSRHVGDLKRIAKTPIDLEIVKGSMRPDDFARLKATIDRAKEATAGLGRETAKAGQEAAKAAREADKFAASMAKMGTGKTIDNSGLNAAAFAKGGGGVAATNTQQTLTQLKGVQAEIARLRQLARTPIEMPMLKSSFSAADFAVLRKEVLAARKATAGLGNDFNKTGQQAQGLGTSLGFVGRILAAMAIRQVAREIFQMADAFTTFQNKLKTVVQEDSVGLVSKEIFNIAQESRTSLESITTAFSRTTRSVKALGKSQKEVLQFTGTLSKAIQLGGSNAVEASNAMIQLSQGMGSGALRGDELRSVLEQLPIVAELIADKMGVPIAALRLLGSEGKITTEVIFDAINNRTAEIDEKMKNMQLTVGQAWTRLVNQMTMESSRLGGVMKALANTIQFVTDHMDFFITAFLGLSSALAAGFVIKGINALIAGFYAYRAAAAAAAAGTAIATGGLSLLTSALAVAVAALIPFIAEIKLAEEGTATFGDIWKATWEELSADKMSTAVDGIKTVTMEVEGLTQETKNFMLTFAKAIDFMREGTGMGLVLPLIDKIRGSETPLAIETVQNIIDTVEENASLRQTNKLIEEGKEILAADLAEGRGPNTQGPAKAKKAKNPKGQTFDELMQDLNKNRDKALAMDDASDPSIEGRVMRGWLDAVDKLEDKIANNLTDAQSKLIEKTIEEKVILEDMLKLRESIQKSMVEEQKAQVQELIDGIKLQIEREKANKELVKEFQEAKADREIDKKNQFNTVADSLDPGMATNRQIQTLIEFKAMADKSGLPEWAALAKKNIDDLHRSMKWENSHFETFANQMNSIFGPGGSLVRGFADAAANAIVMSQGLGDLKRAIIDVLNSVQKQALSALIELPLNLAMGSLQNAFLQNQGLGSSAPSQRGATSPTTAIPGQGGIFRDAPFADGGYTGDYGVNEQAGIVHGQEYVLNADATRRMGRQTLDAINKGASMSSGKPPTTNITVNNNAGVQVETREVSPGEIQIMITKAIHDQTPKVVAGHINNPNSIVSKSLSKNISSERRR